MTATDTPDGPWSVAFDGGPGTPSQARESTAAFLAAVAGHLPPRDSGRPEQVLLVVSELVTNAVRHAPGPVVLALALVPGDGSIGITVRDTSSVLPRPRTPDLLGGGGFGWSTIVEPHTTGQDIRPHPAGKEIHALLPW